MCKSEKNHRDRLCSRGAAKSIPRVLLLDEQTLIWGRRRVTGLHANPAQAARISLFLFPGTRAILPLVVELPQGALLMEWVTPQHEEIDLNCEISSYANAEL
jgi:hypothetical protein